MNQKKIHDFPNVEQLAEDLVALCESSFEYDSPWNKQQFLEDFQSPFALYLILCENDQIIGFLNGYTLFEEYELFLLAVSAKYQNKGFGTRLLEWLYQELAHTEVNSILLEVRESNSSARKFYISNGFDHYHTRKAYYNNPVEDAYLLRKEVRSFMK